MATATFTSASRNLFVGFPPETFGRGVGADGEPADYPLLRFKDGLLTLDDSDDFEAKLITMLREHNEFNNSFNEAGNSLDTVIPSNRINVQVPDGGITDDVEEHLERLIKAAKGSIPPNSIQKTVGIANNMYDLFQAQGIQRHQATDDVAVIKATLTLFFSALKKGELWDDG